MAITNCNKIITLDYLDDFIKSNSSSLIQDDNGEPVSVNYHGYPSTYCPTYSDLMSGDFIPYAQTLEHVESDGIRINGEYTNNQNVRIEDLVVDYTRFNSLSLSAAPTTFHVSGGTSTLSYDLSFNKYTKSLSGTSCDGIEIGSEEIKDTTTTVEWIQNPIIGEINYPNFTINRVESAMTSQLSGKITFRGHEESCDLPIEFHLTGTNCSCSDFIFTSYPSQYASGETSYKYANYSAGTCISVISADVTSYSTTSNWLDVYLESENNWIKVLPKNPGVNTGPSRSADVTVYYSGPNCVSAVTFNVTQAGGCDCQNTISIPTTATTTGLIWDGNDSGTTKSVNVNITNASCLNGTISGSCSDAHFSVSLSQTASNVVVSASPNGPNTSIDTPITGEITLSYNVNEIEGICTYDQTIKLTHNEKICDCDDFDIIS